MNIIQGLQIERIEESFTSQRCVVSASTPSVSPFGKMARTQGCDWYNDVVLGPYPQASVFQVKT